MRNQRVGQATFIPLDTIQVKSVNDKFRSIAKGARLALDVVQYEPAVERAIHHACGNALVCDTLEIARNVCFTKNQDVKGSCLSGLFANLSLSSEGIRFSCYPGWFHHPQEWVDDGWP